jgi:plastocyanin
MKLRRWQMVPALAAIVLVAAACASKTSAASGSGTNSPATSPSASTGTHGMTVTVTMVNYSFSPSTLKLKAGEKFTLTAVNNGTTAHTFTIPGVVDTGAVAPGQSKTVSFTVPSKTVQFFCTFHKSIGMVGRLVVTGTGSGGGGASPSTSGGGTWG